MNSDLPRGSMPFDDDTDFAQDLHDVDETRANERPRSAYLTCPSCDSLKLQVLHWGRRAGCILGAIAGVAGGIAAGSLRAPSVPSPPLRWIGLLSAAVIGGITAGSAGCSSGAALGDMLDRRILPTHRCLQCGKRFSHTYDLD